MRPHAFARPNTGLVLGWLLALSTLPEPSQAEPLRGGDFVLVGAPLAGGISAGVSFEITGHVAPASGSSSGAEYELVAGLFGLTFRPEPGAPVLSAEITPLGNVRIWWPAGVQGYQLESSLRLGGDANWLPAEPAPTGNQYEADPTSPARFYRLRRL